MPTSPDGGADVVRSGGAGGGGSSGPGHLRRPPGGQQQRQAQKGQKKQQNRKQQRGRGDAYDDPNEWKAMYMRLWRLHRANGHAGVSINGDRKLRRWMAQQRHDGDHRPNPDRIRLLRLAGFPWDSLFLPPQPRPQSVPSQAGTAPSDGAVQGSVAGACADAVVSGGGAAVQPIRRSRRRQPPDDEEWDRMFGLLQISLGVGGHGPVTADASSSVSPASSPAPVGGGGDGDDARRLDAWAAEQRLNYERAISTALRERLVPAAYRSPSNRLVLRPDQLRQLESIGFGVAAAAAAAASTATATTTTTNALGPSQQLPHPRETHESSSAQQPRQAHNDDDGDPSYVDEVDFLEPWDF